MVVIGLVRAGGRTRPVGAFRHLPPLESAIGDDRVTVYSSGDDLYEDMLAAIRAARRTIYFNTFIWKGDEVGESFKAALQEASSRGVDVYVVFDGFGNLVVPRDFKRMPDSLEAIEYPVWAPGWRFYDPRRYGRDHQKILVVDDTDGFVGGYNVGSRFAKYWRDTHVRLQGPGCWNLANAFVALWNSRRQRHQPKLSVPTSSTWDSRIRVHRNVPRERMFPIRDMYVEAINRAQRHIYLTHAYFVPDPSILDAMFVAADRGVDVRLLTARASNHASMDWLGRGFYSTLLRGGIRVFLYEQTMIHAKTATIDSEWTTIGTANIDRLSLAGNYEINAELFDASVAHHMEQIFSCDSDQATEVSLSEWESRKPWVKAGEQLMAPLRPLL